MDRFLNSIMLEVMVPVMSAILVMMLLVIIVKLVAKRPSEEIDGLIKASIGLGILILCTTLLSIHDLNKMEVRSDNEAKIINRYMEKYEEKGVTFDSARRDPTKYSDNLIVIYGYTHPAPLTNGDEGVREMTFERPQKAGWVFEIIDENMDTDYHLEFQEEINELKGIKTPKPDNSWRDEFNR